MDMTIRGNATVLAIGTAVPPNCIYQSDYPDYYFRVTNSQHQSELKEKFERICNGSKIEKCYFHLTEEMIKDHPDIASHSAHSLDTRNALLSVVPELGKEAVEKALQEWGQPKSKITHLIFHTGIGCVELPGPDCRLINLLGLGQPTVNRIMLYNNGYYVAATVLRLAKDIVENNPSARVLAVCSEITLSIFRGPEESDTNNLVTQALFSDGAAAIIVGSNPDLSTERPLFEIASAAQTLLPDTTDLILGRVTEACLTRFISPDVAMNIADSIGRSISGSLAPLGINDDLNSLFWIVHPGGPKILDGIENKLKLEKEKLAATRRVLAEYGNLASATVLFIMDEMRRRSKEEGKSTTGEGAQFGLFIGMGPSLTIETAPPCPTSLCLILLELPKNITL